MSKFRPIDRDTPMPLPSVQELLPKDHLARYMLQRPSGCRYCESHRHAALGHPGGE